ncbi:MAG: diguanylate cyclase [Okeania sp. SIO3B5]|uniref:diguanylate cyclase n=1 Tax=Okeania sp. SIO3B5 TaxID=2607811 RepID=UPI001400A783|nr:diguanylate cyclase [Okeania sp. SIO3B5]NEO54471.1 diguanylate cyclase [Okeania sp. SIO3B5]
MSTNTGQFLNSQIEKAIEKNPLIVTSDMPLTEAINQLSQAREEDEGIDAVTESNQSIKPSKRSSCLLVVENNQLLGILTERDIVRLITQEISIENLKINDVMTRQLITIVASDIENILTVVNCFRQHKIRHLPVLSKTGELVGLITVTSLRNSLKSVDLLKHRQVKEVMTTNVIHGSPDLSIFALAEKMAKYQVSSIVIVRTDPQQQLYPIGIVTERDIVQFQALGMNIRQFRASKVMSTPLHSLTPFDSLWVAHQKMQRLRVKRLVVCGSNDQLLGIVTQTSLLENLNTVDMYGMIQILQQEVDRLQTEKIEMLHRNNNHLEQKVQHLQESVNRLEQHNQEMATINQMIDFLQACEKIEDTKKMLAEFIKKLFPDFSGIVLSRDEDNNKFESVSHYGNLAHSEMLLEFSHCSALRHQQIHIASNTQPELFCSHVHQKPQITGTICIPLLSQGKVWGIFYLQSELPQGISNYQQQLARTVAEQISLGLYNLKLREKLRNESIRDSLTGLFNRRYLDESLKQEIIKAKRYQQPLSIIMVDVDHFKQFNDTYGHDVGDIVLQKIAHFLQTKVRKYDIVCRYGGEEMTVILTNTTLEIAQKRADMICSGVSKLSLQNQGETLLYITVSLGVACFPLHGTTGEQIIQRADEALYQAKKAGRNRVVLYQLKQ